MKLQMNSKTKSFIVLDVYAEACNELAGASPWHCTETTQLQSVGVEVVVSLCNTISCLDDPGFELQTETVTLPLAATR